MVKLIFCLKRKPGMSSAEFHRYWRDVHGPLARNAPDFFGYVRRYTQSYALDAAMPGFSRLEPSEFDGVTELWFDSMEDVVKAYGSPSYVERIGPDGWNFVDMKKVLMLVTEELVIHG